MLIKHKILPLRIIYKFYVQALALMVSAFFCCLFGCKEQKSKALSNNKGVIKDLVIFYDIKDSILHIDSTLKQKIWFKDSLIIDEVRDVVIYSDSKISTIDFKLKYYRFTDLRTKNVWIFSNFSDTAKAWKSYNIYDSTDIVGGWDFKRKWEDRTFKFRFLRDTIINKVKYQIYMAKGPDTTKNDALFAYATDSGMYPVFSLDYNLSNEIKLPILKTDYSTTQEVANRIVNSSLTLLRDSLTTEEEKVFKAWERYSQQNPVVKKR